MSELPSDALQGLTVLERGWLSSNNILIHARPGEAGAWLVDTGHVNHAQQTVALVRHALAGAPLAGVVNTHLHGDHCGGNAALQRAFDRRARVPRSMVEAVHHWDTARLGYDAMGQRCERFEAGGSLAPGETLRAGARDWEALASPGHDPDSLMLFDRAHGVLISADALWRNGFGMVFPEMIGEPGFDDVGATLDLIASLPVRVVIPGHGAPFTDVVDALARSRARLAAFQSEPMRHSRHAVKVMLKYHLMEEGSRPLPDLLAWATTSPMTRTVLNTGAALLGLSARGWCELLLGELLNAGVLGLDGAVVRDVG